MENESTVKEIFDSKIAVTIHPKRSLAKIIINNGLFLAFTALLIWISKGSAWWTFVTVTMFMAVSWGLLSNAIRSRSNAFDNIPDAIKFLEDEGSKAKN